MEIQGGGPEPVEKLWLEKKTRFENIIDDIGVELR